MWYLSAIAAFTLLSVGNCKLLQRQPTYAVVAPNVVRPNMEFVVSATVLKMEYSSFTINAIIRKLKKSAGTERYEELTSGRHTFTREGTHLIKIKTLDDLEAGNYTLRVAGFSDSDQGQIFTNDTELFFEQKQISVLIQTSKPFYRQGQTVRFRVIPVETNLMSVSTVMDVMIKDPNGFEVRKWDTLHTNAGGVASLSYPLNHNLLSYGDWSIEVFCRKYIYRKSFRVEEFYAPLFYVNVSMPTLMFSNSYGLSGLVASNHTTGRGTKGEARIVLQIKSVSGVEDRVIDPIVRDITFFDSRADFLFTKGEMERAAGGQENLEGKELKVTAYVKDWFYNSTAVGFQSAIVHNTDVQLEFLGGNVWTYKPNLPFKIYISASKRDGSPLDPFNPNRTINLIINRDTDVELRTTAFINKDNSIAEYWVDPQNYNNIIIQAKYFNIEDTKRTLTARKYWSPNELYLQLTTPTKRPTVGQYLIVNVKTNTFIEKIQYYITSAKGIVVSDTLQMYSRNKLFSVALSRDMAPTSRIVAYFIAPDGQVVADSLNFPVDGTSLHEMTVKFNRGKDLSYQTVEITATADPLSYVAFSAIEYQLYGLGARNGLVWEEVYEELYGYNRFANTSIRHYWRKDGQVDGGFYASTPTFGHDANSTFFYAGLYMFTDANVSRTYDVRCNKTEGWLPCMDGLTCYTHRDMCNYNKLCTDAKDEMGCPGNQTYNVKLYNDDSLWRTKHIGAFFQDGGFMWKDQYTKPNGRIDIRVNVPTFPTSWVVSGFAMSKENGLSILNHPGIFDAVRPMFISVQAPKVAKRGEHLSLRISIFNYWDEEMDVLITIPKSDKYYFMEVDREAANYLQKEGDQQILVVVFPGSNRQINVPIKTNVGGHVAIPVTATSPVGGHTVTHHVWVEYEGIEERYLLNYPFNLKQATAEDSSLFKIPVEELLLQQDDNVPNYISESPKTKIYIQGDIIGTSFFPGSNYDLNTKKLLLKPYGDGAEATYNFGINVNVLKMYRELLSLSADQTNKVIYTLNVQMQEMLSYMNSDGSFKEFRWSEQPSTWLTAIALSVLAEASENLDDLTNFFRVPEQAVKMIGKHLQSVQRSDGAITETSDIYNPRFSSYKTVIVNNTEEPRNIALTALTLISIKKAEAQIKNSDETLSRGFKYLSQFINDINDVFELSIVAYAFQRGGQAEAADLLSRLSTMARENGGQYYFSLAEIPPNSGTIEQGQFYYYHKELSNNTAYSVAATSYAMLANIKAADEVMLNKMQTFLQNQHDHVGGFSSTMDSLIAFEALKTLAGSDLDRPQYEMSFVFASTVDQSWKPTATLTPDNWFEQQVFEAPSHWGFISVQVTGFGRALLQMETFSNHEFQSQLRNPNGVTTVTSPMYFDLGEFDRGVITSGFNHSTISYSICPKWVGDFKAFSGMAVLEVGIPTGYVVVNKTLQAYVRSHRTNTTLRNAEFYDNKAVFYFSQLNGSDTNCAKFTATRWYPVANVTEHQYIKVYEYYQPGHFNHTFYEKIELEKLTVCLVCGSYQCPYCPYYASGSIITPNITFYIAATIFTLILRLNRYQLNDFV